MDRAISSVTSSTTDLEVTWRTNGSEGRRVATTAPRLVGALIISDNVSRTGRRRSTARAALRAAFCRQEATRAEFGLTVITYIDMVRVTISRPRQSARAHMTHTEQAPVLLRRPPGDGESSMARFID